MATAQGIPGNVRQGQQPTPQQVQAMQQQFYAEAAKRGLTPQQFAEQLRQQQQQQAAQGDHEHNEDDGDGDESGQHVHMQPQTGTQVPIQPGPPKPEAIAVANFLKNQNLKSRTCIFEEKRRELFKVKRAIRALQSPEYEKARSKKNSALPAVTDKASAAEVFKLLPMSFLALRVSKVDPDEPNPPHGHPGHRHGGGATKVKGQKGVWTVKIEQQQDTQDQNHYMWFYEGSQWRQKLYAIGALIVVMAVVLFPLWPYTLRVGVWYLSMASLGLLGAFFGLAIFRLILFVITIGAVPPGIWLYPNLFEDVGFFDSFRPVWAWRETPESIAAKKAEKKEKKLKKRNKARGKEASGEANGSAKPNAVTSNTTKDIPIASKTGATGSAASEGIAAGTSVVTERKNMQARVEEEEE